MRIAVTPLWRPFHQLTLTTQAATLLIVTDAPSSTTYDRLEVTILARNEGNEEVP